ncbi:MAG: hypothetical protein KY432_08420, partial [Acidobacteria bacterium]|nr:hypothetical protein [Acidobacteriota bacterium]
MKRSITFVFIMIALVLSSSSTAWGFGKNKIVYDDFDWKIYSSTHFDVYFYEEERDSLQKVVNLAESAYDEISRKFEFQITDRIPLIFYETHSAFEQTNVILMFIPEGVGAFAEPVKNRMVLPIDMPDEKLYALLKHELTHIFEFDIIPRSLLRRGLPLWVDEGLADHLTGYWNPFDLMTVRDAAITDNIPAMSEANMQAFVSGRLPYNLGHAAFE